MTRRSASLRDAVILVTGGTGLIGRHLLVALSDAGANVFAVARPGREHLVWPLARSITWDLAGGHLQSRLPSRIDAVVHLAAPRKRRTVSIRSLREHINISVDATARVFDAARTRHASHAVFVSTIAAQSPRDRRRRSTVLPSHPYAMTKRWAEELSASLRDVGLGVSIFRPGPVYGPGQSENGLLAGFASRLRRREPIVIAAPNGRLVSPVFVGDVVDVIVRSLAGPTDTTCAIGGPRAYRERAFAEDLAARLGVRATIRTDARLHAGRYDIDNSDIDRRFPGRLRTPWQVGLDLTWRRRP
jgi:nucleoside-diphosphate-sugar epimerase